MGGSHHTTLMLFKNIKDIEIFSWQLQISKNDLLNELKGKKALEHIDISQKLVPRTKHFVTDKIKDVFKVKADPDLIYLVTESANHFLLSS